MFGIASQARVSVSSSVFDRTSTQNLCVGSISMVSCQQLGNISATIQCRGNYKKTVTRNIGRNWSLVGKKKKIENIDWPSMSPDIAHIENVWQILKMKLRKKNFTTYQSLVSAIKQEWKALPNDLSLNLIHSMKNKNF